MSQNNNASQTAILNTINKVDGFDPTPLADIDSGSGNEVVLHSFHIEGNLAFGMLQPEPCQLCHNGQSLPLLLGGKIHILYSQGCRVKAINFIDGAKNRSLRCIVILTHISHLLNKTAHR